MASTEIESLFARSLIGEYEDDAPWKAVHELRRIGSREVFTVAQEWCLSADPNRRARGVDVLAPLGRTAANSTVAFREESYDVITELLRKETELLPLDSELSALGHLEIPDGIPWLIRFSNHANPDIRFTVASALGSFANDTRSVATLLVLMKDPDDDVRDWAAFGVGTLSKLDSMEIREALVNLLRDPCEDAQAEAVMGLAERKDLRVLPQLIALLSKRDPGSLLMDAAKVLLDCRDDSEELTAMEYAEALTHRFSL